MKTSWGPVADWYDKVVHSEDSYQVQVILPNLLRIMEPSKEKVILDVACGEGFFARAMASKGARVIGVDIAKELIEIAKARAGHTEEYHVGGADNLTKFETASIDDVSIVLALQNIEPYIKVLREVGRVIKKRGKFVIILNHPVLRTPGISSWGYDEGTRIQYRRIDEYLSESKKEIDMHPGTKDTDQKVKTVSFHRPLQMYAKALHGAGFAISRIEEWTSHKESESGPRKSAEDKARREIPMFMCLECVKL